MYMYVQALRCASTVAQHKLKNLGSIFHLSMAPTTQTVLEYESMNMLSSEVPKFPDQCLSGEIGMTTACAS